MGAAGMGMPIYMMDDKDGTGDGELGKLICVMGTP
jgi:hypothetical protein